MSKPEAFEPRFPFAAVVGQERMKLALLLNAVHPGVGGVLIRGNKGTAKSTIVRALAALLPPIDVVAGCPYRCAPGGEREACLSCGRATSMEATVRPVPIVELPVGASEDRLTGALDIEKALQTGDQAFQPGLLAAAHRGVLYIDEVNLLSDHLVDVLLDAAAMGRNYVERDGLSVSHPARFILVGTMNPEEGDLRPQLLDRFGLMVEAEDGFTPSDRAEVVRRRIAFERDPVGFVTAWEADQATLRARIDGARAALPGVYVPDRMVEAITTLCAEQGVDGLRADIAIYRAACASAAWNGRAEVSIDDVREAALLALAHRQRRQPFQEPRLDQQALDAALDRFDDDSDDAGEDDPGGEGPLPPHPSDEGGAGAPDAVSPIGDSPPLALSNPPPKAPHAQGAPGRRLAVHSSSHRGRHISSRIPAGPVTDLDLPATLRAAAPLQRRRRPQPGKLVLLAHDLREKVREDRAGTNILFVVDASGSMGARQRMEATKGAILALLTDAYQRRDRVGMIAFRGRHAELMLPMTGSVDLAQRKLADFATGGRTPLAEGLRLGRAVIERIVARNPGTAATLVLVSDGRANAAAGNGDPFAQALAEAASIAERGIAVTVVDTESGQPRLGLARRFAGALNADYISLAEMEAATATRISRRGRV